MYTYISGYQNENDIEEIKPSYQVLRVLRKYVTVLSL